MLFNFKLFFLLFLSINLFANIGDRFIAQKVKSNKYVDYYLVKKSKEKINYLNKMGKLSLLGSRNDFISNENILTARNSNLIDIAPAKIELSDENTSDINEYEISVREIEMLRVIDMIILTQDSIDVTFNCDNLVLDVLNQNGENIDPPFNSDECSDLNEKFEHFYGVGLYSVKDLNGTILDKYRGRVHLDDMCEIDEIVKKIKYSKSSEYDMINSVRFYNNQFLEQYSSSLSSLNRLYRSFHNKESLITAMRERAIEINDLNNTIDITNTQNNLTQYIFNPYICGEIISGNSELNITQNIENLLLAKQARVAEVNDEIAELSIEHQDLLDTEPPDLPFPPYNIQHDAWETQVNDVFSRLTTAQQNQTTLNSEIAILQGFLNDPTTIPENETFATHMYDIIGERIVENIIYNKLQKLQTISSYINRFILHYGTTTLPLQVDLVNMDLYWGNDEVDAIWWPKQFNGSSDINFNIDLTNRTITFSNIFSTSFSNSIQSFETNVRTMFQNNIALDSKASFNTTGGVFEMIIPLELKTIAFIEKIDEINARLVANVVGDTNATSPRTLPCSALQNLNNTAFVPDGSGGFTLDICNGTNWISQSSMVSNDINTNINNTNIYRENNNSFSIFSLHNHGGEFVYRNNGAQAERGLIINGQYRRIDRW